jgi:hypothetical protein
MEVMLTVSSVECGCCLLLRLLQYFESKEKCRAHLLTIGAMDLHTVFRDKIPTSSSRALPISLTMTEPPIEDFSRLGPHCAQV